MSLSDALEKFGRAIFEQPFGASRLTDAAPELAEIRLALADAVKAASHRAGSVRVFPFDLVRLTLRGIPEEQAAALQSGLLAEFLLEDLGAALTRSSIRFSTRLRLDLHTTSDLPMPGEPWMSVETARTPAAAPDAAPEQGPAALVVVEGTANMTQLALSKARIHIGRGLDVYRSDGPSRKNDLAFIEDTEINRTVSREHAHILKARTSGEYRLFNDRWYKTAANCGLWILRDGLSQPVHRGDRGVALQPGDEIHLGRAVVRFIRSNDPRIG